MRVVEISRNGDNRLGHLFAEIGLGGLPHPRQDKGADLARAVALAAGLDPGIAVVAADDLVRHQGFVLFDHRVVIAPADEPLDCKNRILRVGDRLAACRLPDQHLAGARKRDHRRRRARPFRVLDHFGFAAFHHGDTGKGRPQIDPDDFGHSTPPAQKRKPPQPERPARSWLNATIRLRFPFPAAPPGTERSSRMSPLPPDHSATPRARWGRWRPFGRRSGVASASPLAAWGS